MKVLYADESYTERQHVVPILQALGAQVTEVDTLQLAIAAFATNKYDAVVVDGSLESKDNGWEWATMLHTQHVHVMVHSSGKPPQGTPADLLHLDKLTGPKVTRDFLAQFLRDSVPW